MKPFIFCNGKFLEEGTPCIAVNDRGFLFGDGVFTTIKVKNGVPELLDLHLIRLEEQCKTLKIIPPKIFLSDIEALILKNKALIGVWRLKLIVTGGKSAHLNLQTREYGNFVMLLTEAQEFSSKKIKLTLFPSSIKRPTSHLKTLSYLDRLWISEYAFERGFDDAVLLSLDGYITETAFSNIFWYSNGAFFVPDPSLELLMGITITHWIAILKSQGYKIHFVKEKIEKISTHVQLFICNAIKGVLPVVEMGGKEFHTDPEIEKVFKHVKRSE